MFSMCGPGDRGRGPWVGAQKNGLGRQVFANTDEYLGMWAQHKPEGKGKYKWNAAPQKHEYFGEWKAGEAHGRGKLETFSIVPPQIVEKTYEGEWANGKANGFGIRVEANGSAYHGGWKDDLQDGPGIEMARDDDKEVTCVYTGQFVKGKRHGYGEIFWTGPQGKVDYIETTYGSEQVFVAERYKGQFENNEMNGFGHCVWQDGRDYKGQWRKGLMHGFGVHTWVGDTTLDKDKAENVKGSKATAFYTGFQKTYSGHYVDGIKHGHGILDYGDGRRYEGELKDNKMHGAGKYTNTFLAGMKAEAEDEEGWWEGEWCEGRHVRWTDGHKDNVVHDLRQAQQYTVGF